MNKHSYSWELRDELKETLRKQQKERDELAKAAGDYVRKSHKKLFGRK